LTEEWRATWPKSKQNCWQARCHAGSHPPDGFSFPKDVPALVGQDALTKFSSAGDLYSYIRATMPYWSPTLLADEEYQAITAFLVEANYAEQGLEPVSLPSDLAAVALHPVMESPEPAAVPPAQPTAWPLPLLLGLTAGLLALAIGWKRARAKPS
jgi:hypothetical protein